MWLRGIEQDAWPQARRWAPLTRISRNLQRAVLASEDQRFCTHAGFDWVELRRVWREYQSGEGDRGASTITNQLAKNVFLWPGRSLIRKGQLLAYETHQRFYEVGSPPGLREFESLVQSGTVR